MKQYIPHINILIGGITWGLIGLFNRNLVAGGFSPDSIVVVRNFGGLLLMTLIFALFDRKVFRVNPRHLHYFFGTGVVSVLLFTMCAFRCQQHCSLAVAAILLYTAPAFVVIMSAVLFKDKITKKKLVALVLAFLGCTFVSGIWSGGLSISMQSLLLGLGSAFFYALYSIFGRYALAHYQPMTVVYYTFVFAGLGSIFVAKPAELSLMFRSSWMFLLGVGLVVVSTVLPYIF